MTETAREIMSTDVECIGTDASIAEAAQRLAQLDVGSMPICGADNRLAGMLTDRDIVVDVVAPGKDPETTKAGELGDGKPVTIGADDPVEEAGKRMREHQVRRLPVIDGHDLVGIISQADLARTRPEAEVGETVEEISA